MSKVVQLKPRKTLNQKIDFKIRYPYLPLRDTVFFPHISLSLFVGRIKSINSVQEAMNSNRLIFVSAQKVAKSDEINQDSVYNVGVICEILQLLKLSDGNYKVLLEGLIRSKITNLNTDSDSIKVKLEIFSGDDNIVLQLIKKRVVKTFLSQITLPQKVGKKDETSDLLKIRNHEKLSNIMASYLDIEISKKQAILQEVHLEKKYLLIEENLQSNDNISFLHGDVIDKTRERISKSQKDYFLNEQIKVIKEELGDVDDEINLLKVKAEETHLSDIASKKVIREISRLEKTPAFSPETGMLRNYIDWLLDLPWGIYSKESEDIKEAKAQLTIKQYGLEEAKERLLEFIAVNILTGNPLGTVLCLSGPPGVGKTTLAKTLASVLGRELVRIPLGGLKDEAEIRGHRRTYIGAMPGKIIQGIKNCKTSNPVILLDEIDKINSDFRGDPAAALLEILDPEQNRHFQDHYLEVPFDLSKVIFIATANAVHKIPHALRDRLEVLELSAYTDFEKLHIFQKFLLPKLITRNGLTKENITIPEKFIFNLIRHYTKEAGVRELERLLDKILRKVALKLVEIGRNLKIIISDQLNGNYYTLEHFLGIIKYKDKLPDKEDKIGIVNGLAWTEAGGTLLLIESTIYKGKGLLKLTGNLGDVMKESAEAALSYVRENYSQLIDKDFFKEHDIHIHIPQGAIPKDGPSAGITLAVSFLSIILKKNVKGDIALTGEISLKGDVLSVGGIKEKVLAAFRSSIYHVILPADNKDDIKRIPDKVTDKMHFSFVDNIEAVFKLLFDNHKSP